jgi:hypothetical protein
MSEKRKKTCRSAMPAARPGSNHGIHDSRLTSVFDVQVANGGRGLYGSRSEEGLVRIRVSSGKDRCQLQVSSQLLPQEPSCQHILNGVENTWPSAQTQLLFVPLSRRRFQPAVLRFSVRLCLLQPMPALDTGGGDLLTAASA